MRVVMRITRLLLDVVLPAQYTDVGHTGGAAARVSGTRKSAATKAIIWRAPAAWGVITIVFGASVH